MAIAIREAMPEYRSWAAMKRRCYNPKSDKWRRYGGRGITVCERWRTSFADFLEDMGRRPGPNYSIDRINNDGDYEPGNCRWATAREQASNRTYCAKAITHNGISLSIRGWARAIAISPTALRVRLSKRTVVDALTSEVCEQARIAALIGAERSRRRRGIKVSRAKKSRRSKP